MFKGGYVYIVTNKNKTTLYIGVTSNIVGRIYEHRDHKYKNSFTDKYNAEFLIYYEVFDSIEAAIAREKEIKKWNRGKKEGLINSINPEWRDLYEDVLRELFYCITVLDDTNDTLNKIRASYRTQGDIS